MIALGIINNLKQELLRRRRLRNAIGELDAECKAEVDLAHKEYADACAKILYAMAQNWETDNATAKADRDQEIALLRYEQRINDAHETYERKLNLLLYNS